MSALFNPPKPPAVLPPPTPPQLDDPAVVSRADAERRERIRVGRASQFMTNPQAQRIAGPSAKRYLGAI